MKLLQHKSSDENYGKTNNKTIFWHHFSSFSIEHIIYDIATSLAKGQMNLSNISMIFSMSILIFAGAWLPVFQDLQQSWYWLEDKKGFVFHKNLFWIPMPLYYGGML